MARQSIFGPADDAPWTPLSLGTFFSEGWRDAWIAPPDRSGGAPRQGRIGAADGNFDRLYWISSIESFHTSGAPDGDTSRVDIDTPLSRRLLIATIRTVNANSSSSNLGTTDRGSSGAAVHGVCQGTGTSLGDFTDDPAANVATQVAPTAPANVTLGPGYRTHLGNDWYSLGAVTVPVTGPHPYDESLTLWLMRTF